MISRIEMSFGLLKSIRKEISGWIDESLDDITNADVYEVINLLRLFLEIKEGVKKNEKMETD